MKADILREKYLQFFRSKGHKVAESDSLVPKDDPTVLFTPAGMNQFKKQFLGMITDFTRAASSQRCLRTDDLDKVGKTDCHHTFFEMLGNFSFGDYFKKEAIAWAWEFLTQELAIAPERLWVSVYKDDDEAYDIWKNDVKFPAAKIVRLGDHENFWPADAKENGPNGPCGPCSEIFIDLGPSVGCKKPDCSPACSCGRFIEIWNLVFTQFNRKDGGVLEPLPQKNIDTGMGLERITAVMQGVTNNFETDLFQPIIQEIIASADLKRSPNQLHLNAIADHIRAVVFSIFDGILPSNEARGYVVRKIIRKAILHLRSLGCKKPFLYKLVPVLAGIMKKPYPELTNRQENIADIILSEEKNFINTLDTSSALLEEKYSVLKSNPDAASAGKIAFELYDTYGIPLVLTTDWLAKNKLPFSQEVFEAELNQQKARSKSGSAMQGDVFSLKEAHLKDVAATVFSGYDTVSGDAKIIKILRDGQETDRIQTGEEAKLILDSSVFYAESGGQVGDTGFIRTATGVFEVADTRKFEKVFLHVGTVKEGTINSGDPAQAQVDVQRRLSIARNHTATHLLQAALRKVLGDHVQQQGSWVGVDRLRFDFTHFKQVSQQELDRIEEIVNGLVIGNLPVSKREMSLEEARKQGALAFFAEKYEDTVRVVSVEGVSKEFCGGTHLDQTGFIGLFKILHESSVASGVRRIEAATGSTAYRLMKEEQEAMSAVAQALRAPVDKAVSELEKRLKTIKDMEKQLASQRLQSVAADIDRLIARAADIKGVKVIMERLQGADMDILRKAADLIKQKEQRVVIALGSGGEGRANLIIATNIPSIDSQAMIKQVAPEIGGSGGGRKDFAQAGGTQPDRIEAAFEKIQAILKNVIA
ncbi:MAG TPA: alanine--tRNA ligase [Candidatus Omnitrophota bacterium]|nr:alanine--tRNA ligase [Candidatus Omnitrophota bacterium]HQQ06270.1 alanine--tRNA ligase [Candidatus Omnitrophota bacterium]